MKIDARSANIIYGLSVSLIIILVLSKKEIISQIAAQSHNIFIDFFVHRFYFGQIVDQFGHFCNYDLYCRLVPPDLRRQIC